MKKDEGGGKKCRQVSAVDGIWWEKIDKTREPKFVGGFCNESEERGWFNQKDE